MKIYIYFLFFLSSYSFSFEGDIFEDIFLENKIYKTPDAISYCESNLNKGWGCDYLSAISSYEYYEEVASGEFNPIYKTQMTSISDYTGSNHSVSYIPVKVSGVNVLLKFDTATSKTIVNATGDIPKSPFKSPFYEDYGENFGLIIDDLEGETFKIKGKNIYTTASDNNIAGQDIIEIVGGFELSLLSVRPDPKDYECNKFCQEFDIERKGGKWYISYDLEGIGLDLVLDTGSEISSISKKIADYRCYNLDGDFYIEVRSNKEKLNDIEFCKLGLMGKNNSFLSGEEIYGGFDGSLGADFFNKFERVIFDTKDWKVLFYD